MIVFSAAAWLLLPWSASSATSNQLPAAHDPEILPSATPSATLFVARATSAAPGERLEPFPHAYTGRHLNEDLKLCHGVVNFTTHGITTQADRAQAVAAADLDGDGDLDVLSASTYDDTIAWYENLDGAGDFSGPQRVITIQADGARSIAAADIDGDGDLDVLSASYNDDKIAWYENLDGVGNFSGPQRVITTWANGAMSVAAADLDGDGDLDVLSASYIDDDIAWYENLDGAGNFSGPERVIDSWAYGARSVAAADLDGDSDLDVLYLAAYYGSEIAWLENLDGLGDFSGPQRVIMDHQNDDTRSVAAADLDGDGDLDVLWASPDDDYIAWYENLDGAGDFSGPQRVIAKSQANLAQSVAAADLDGDGDLDVLSASYSDNKIAWYENVNSIGNFSGPQRVITTEANGAYSVSAADLDGDGDFDVLSASYFDDKIAWYENVNGAGNFSGPQRVITTLADGARSVAAADIDGDGDLDVLWASQNDNTIAWKKNLDGAGDFSWPLRVITIQAFDARSVAAADLDGDGDIDVLSASYDDDKIAWYENLDGAGDFAGPQRVITTLANGAVSVAAADLDGDGDMDVLSASYVDDKIAWYENLDGAGDFSGPQRVITTSAYDAKSVAAADLDGDGDLDVLWVSYRDDKIAWYENLDGAGDFSGPQRVITTLADGAISVATADLDGDGHIDVLSASSLDDKIAWYENVDGAGTFSGHVITSGHIRSPLLVAAGDIDGDGDLDVLTASNYEDKVAWYENVDGVGGFSGLQRIITTQANGATSIEVADLDGDGDIDVLSASEYDDKIAWYENECEPMATQPTPAPADLPECNDAAVDETLLFCRAYLQKYDF